MMKRILVRMGLRTALHTLIGGVRGDRSPAPLDPEVQRARAAVLVGGLPERVAQAADRHGEVDWRLLAAALDTLFMATGSNLGVRSFWISPQDSLSGHAPVEVLADKGGPRRVETAAYLASERAATLRAG